MAYQITDEAHQNRIKQELIAVGMNNYGLIKAETRHLPSIIHQDEHIGGVIYGRADKVGGMLVATDKRLLYLDHRLLFKKTEEISYEVVSGVSTNNQGNFTSITVHTRLGDFTLRYVNAKSANHFVHFIENIQLERDKQEPMSLPRSIQSQSATKQAVRLSQDARVFLISHDIGVVSTVDQDGNVHGATVYYSIDSDDQLFFVTKSLTHKGQNILSYHQVAFTVYDANSMQTLQLSGTATIETDATIIQDVTKRILRPRLSGNHATLPPILHISAGDYVVVHIEPYNYNFHDYKTW